MPPAVRYRTAPQQKSAPSQPPEDENPEGKKPKEPGKGTADDPCRDRWWDNRKDIENVQPLREAALAKSDEVKRRTEAIANLKQDKLPAAVTVLRGLGQLTPATRAALKLLDAAVAAKQSLENSRKQSILRRLEAELKAASAELEAITEKLVAAEQSVEVTWKAYCKCRNGYGYSC